MDKTEQFGADNSAEETEAPQEKVKPKNSTEVPENLESIAENKIAEVDRTSEEAIGATDQRLERSKTYYELSPEKTDEILSNGSFKEQLASIADRIRLLAGSTKERILNLISKKEVKKNELREERAFTSIEAGEVRNSEEMTDAINIPEKSEQNDWDKKDQQDAQKLEELREYLSQKIYSKLGISKEQENLALAEAPEEKREAIERSFKNIRDSVEATYDVDTIQGRFDAKNYFEAQEKLQAETLYPIIKEGLERKNFAAIDLENLGVKENNVDINRLREGLGDLVRNRWSEACRQIQSQVYSTLEKEGQYKDIILPTAEEIKDDKIAEAYFKKLAEAVKEEQTKQLGEAVFSGSMSKEDSNWLHEFENNLHKIKNEVQNPEYDKYKVFLSREKVSDKIENELKNANDSNFLSVNLSPKKLEKVLKSGEFKGIFSLEEKELKEHASELSMGGSDLYLKQREVTEKALGIYNVEKAVVYGAFASQNGKDEKYGGAPAYGSISLKLKPEILERTSFTEGDTLTTVGLTENVQRKLSKNKVDRLDHENFALARQISKENVFLAKALINYERKRESDLHRSPNQDFTYLEAHITGGLSIDDFESINIPKEIFERRSYGIDEGNHRELISQLQNDPRWIDKIHITA